MGSFWDLDKLNTGLGYLRKMDPINHDHIKRISLYKVYDDANKQLVCAACCQTRVHTVTSVT
jgi:hypothetical protein